MTDSSTKVLAWQTGLVVAGGCGQDASGIGNYVVLEHLYPKERKKRWSGYLHLRDFPDVMVGEVINVGQPIGNARMGGTGKPIYEGGKVVGTGFYAPHLHMYISRLYDYEEKYRWSKMVG